MLERRKMFGAMIWGLKESGDALAPAPKTTGSKSGFKRGLCPQNPESASGKGSG